MTIGIERFAFALLLALSGATTAHAQDRAFQFALIGDMPYNKIPPGAGVRAVACGDQSQ